MIAIHKRTGQKYRVLQDSFSVERQRPSIVYISLDTGVIFDRDKEKFMQNFTLAGHPNWSVEPKEPRE